MKHPYFSRLPAFALVAYLGVLLAIAVSAVPHRFSIYRFGYHQQVYEFALDNCAIVIDNDPMKAVIFKEQKLWDGLLRSKVQSVAARAISEKRPDIRSLSSIMYQVPATLPPRPAFTHAGTQVSLSTILIIIGFPLLRLFLHQKALAAVGKCPKCGYDLRATPDRCPECGTVPSQPQQPVA